LRQFPLDSSIQAYGILLGDDRHEKDLGKKLNFFLIAAVILALHQDSAQGSLTAREVFEKCRARAVRNDSSLVNIDIQFTQEVEFRSRTGDKDSLSFAVTARHGKFERELISSSVANRNKFNGGYDAFDRMFLLSDYFDEEGKVLTSCEFHDQGCGDCYGISFTLSKASDVNDPLNEVSATLSASDFIPTRINEDVTGLPLGAECDNDVRVAYDRRLDLYFPEKIVVRIYAHLFFLKGEVAVVTITNRNLKKI
jgi:hypothetical protein